jgi:hypothetical protein
MMTPHPSVKPTEPRKPPSVEPTKGESGQSGVKYGSSHNIVHKPTHQSEFQK